MRSELLTPDITVYPGTPAEVRFEVHNTSEVVDRVDVAIPNADEGWIILPEEDLALFPDTSSEVSLLVNVPETHPAGLYRVTAQLRSSVDHGVVSEHEVTVHVAGATSGQLVLRPTMLSGGRRGALRATVTNSGTTELDLVLVATDQTGALEFVLEPHYVVLAASESAEVAITVVGRRSWFANPISHSIDLTAEGSGQQLHAAATFLQKPWIPRGTWTIATLVAIVGLWALIFTLVAQRVTAAGQFGKELPSTLLTGQLDLDTSVVSGTATGVVRAATTGKGLQRVTVEVYRISSKGSRLAASAASAEDGSYTLASLLPGRYALKFNAPGFAELWYPAGTSQSNGEPIAVKSKTTLADLSVALVGNPGSVSGRISVADVSGTRPPVTMQIRPRDGDVLGRPLTPPTVNPDGSFVAKGLPTPGSYQLTVSSTGFVDQKLELNLAGGEDLVVNTIRLSAGLGSISGTVRSADGAGLGGVTVKATRGDFSISTTTPTGGQIGFFELASLESPGTYVLSFVLDGYGVQTLALDLGAGQKRTSVLVDLIGGSGTLAGRVIDAQGNPLGGVLVKATSGTFAVETQSLTGGTIGAYSLTGLKTPGIYAISFSRDGYGTETRQLDLSTSGRATGFDVALSPSLGELAGVFKRAGVETGGVAVTVSDGATARSTATASSPAGAFRMGGLAPGSYTVTFQIPNRAPYTMLVIVDAGRTTTLNPDVDALPPPTTTTTTTTTTTP